MQITVDDLYRIIGKKQAEIEILTSYVKALEARAAKAAETEKPVKAAKKDAK